MEKPANLAEVLAVNMTTDVLSLSPYFITEMSAHVSPKCKQKIFFLFLSDSHGYIDPSLRPIWDLAFLGSSYVMWEKTTQFSHYYMTQLSSVKQWVRETETQLVPPAIQPMLFRLNYGAFLMSWPAFSLHFSHSMNI